MIGSTILKQHTQILYILRCSKRCDRSMAVKQKTVGLNRWSTPAVLRINFLRYLNQNIPNRFKKIPKWDGEVLRLTVCCVRIRIRIPFIGVEQFHWILRNSGG